MDIVIIIGCILIYLILGAFVTYLILDEEELSDLIYTGFILVLWPITGSFIGLEKLEEFIKKKFCG